MKYFSLVGLLFVIIMGVLFFNVGAGCYTGDCYPTLTPTVTSTHVPTSTPTLISTPTVEPKTNEFVLYLPLVNYHTYDCRYDNMGTAWLRNDEPRFLLDWFCVDSGYYKSRQGDTFPHWTGDSIPIFRQGWYEYDLTGYDGDVLVMNEPDVLTQDNMTPQETADYIRHVEALMPAEARMIWWNGNYLSHLRETIAAYGSTPPGIVGLHWYQVTNPGDYRYRDFDGYVTEACAIIGTVPCRVVISEVGICNTNPEQTIVMQELLEFIQTDERIEHTYFFIAYDNRAVGCDVRFWKEVDSTIPYYTATDTGAVLWEFIHNTNVPQYLRE